MTGMVTQGESIEKEEDIELSPEALQYSEIWLRRRS